MCCLAQFIVKYVLIIANFIFALAGLAIIGLGSAAHVQLNNIHDVIPVNLSFITISVIVIGCIIFIVAFFACCGAMRESRCMLITYAVFMAILAAVKIYLTVVIFKFLENTLQNVSEWLMEAFRNPDARPGYHAMETLFQCCGTFSPISYFGMGEVLPPSCCHNPDMQANVCTIQNSYEGCIPRVGNFFDSFGEAIGGILIGIIIVELICMIFGIFLSCEIKKKRYA